MKKLCNFSLLLCLFFSTSLFVGCEKDNVTVGEFTATMESSADKSYISGDPYNRHNCWEATDVIYINGQPAKEFRLDREEWKAIFKPAEWADSYKMFTYGGQNFTWSGNTITFSLPQGYSGQDMPMYATTDDFGPVVFHNLFSVLHFYNIPATGTNTIKVTANNTYYFSNSYNISGNYSVNFSSSTPSVSYSSGGSKTRTFTPATGATEAWMVVPANESQDYEITIKNWGDNYQKTKKKQIINAGKVYNVDYNDISDCVLVGTAAELNAQLHSGEDVYIRLTNDIDFSSYGAISQEFGSGGFFERIKIDGQGHTLTLSKPIYTKLRATIRVYNLNLTGTFTTDYDGAFASFYASFGLLEGNVSATNCNSTVTYNGNPVPFTK